MKLICLVAVLFVITFQDKCRALTMEGGGTKGAYEAGVISGLAYNLSPEERGWDVVSGISVGSIATLGLALFAKGDEKAAADFIQERWLNIKMSDIFTNWPLSIAQGLFEESGLFDTSPEMAFVAGFAGDRSIKRHVTIGMTDSQHGGEYIVTDKNFSKGSDFAKYVIGSSAIPAVFPTLKVNDDVFIDGLAVSDLDIISPINRCKELGFEDKDIVIDIILTNSS
jgi:predicted acylesterase/phospholipase RssA